MSENSEKGEKPISTEESAKSTREQEEEQPLLEHDDAFHPPEWRKILADPAPSVVLGQPSDAASAIIASTSSRRTSRQSNKGQDNGENVFGTMDRGKQPKKKLTIKEKFHQIVNNFSCYNAQYNEFLSRDAFAWFKLCLFYVCFYTALACFFVICLLVFYSTIDPKKPTYINKVYSLEKLEKNLLFYKNLLFFY
jgi:hypothetical protein